MKKVLCLALALAMLLISGCSAVNQSSGAQGAQPDYQSYKDIPGVTQDDIDAVDGLLAKNPRLVYGFVVTSDAFLREDGSVGGFAHLLCNRMSELFGFEFDLCPYTWEEIIDKTLSVEIDLVGDLSASPERLKDYIMTDTIVQRIVKVFTNRNSADLSDTAKLRPVKCAFLDGSTTYLRVADSWKLPFKPVFIDDEAKVPELLSNGEIDAFIEEGILEAAYDEYDFIHAEEYYPLTYSPVSLSTGNPELAPVIKVMQMYLKNGGSYELAQLYSQGYKDYLRNKLAATLTDDEKLYILNHSSEETAILAACEFDNYPSSFYNVKDKEYQGMSMDTLGRISDLTGLVFQVGNKVGTPWTELLEGLESGSYSIVTELLRTDNRENRFLWAQEPYHVDSYAMISRAEHPDIDINQILFARVGLVKDSAYADVFYEWFPNSENAVLFDSNEEAIAALEKGEIELLMSTQNLLLHLTNFLEKPGFKANVVFNYSTGSYFGLNKDEEILCSIVDKAQRYIDMDEIAGRWQRKVFDYESKMLKDMLPFGIGTTAVLLSALIVVFVVLMKNRRINKNLDKTVSLRTNELEAQAATLERRLEQQRLMAALSQSFIAGGDIDAQITDSLRLTGEFLNVSRILLLKYESQSFHYLYEWSNPSQNIKSKLGMALPVADTEMPLIAAYSKQAISHFSLDDTDRKGFIRRYGLDDIENLLMLPIYVGDEPWGVLEFDQCKKYAPWTPSDIDLGEMIAGILSGVMSRRQMEEELVRLSSIVENSPQFITTVRMGGSFAYYNPAAVEISGYSREELDREGLSILLDSGDYRRLKEEIMPLILKNKKHTYELPFITKSGETRIMSVSAFSQKSDSDIICSIASDVTDLVMMQRELERQASELALQTATISSMFASIPDVVFCKDMDLLYTRCNTSFEQFSNCREEDILGKNEEDIFNVAPETLRNLYESEQRVIREKRVILTEEYVPSPSGETRLFETIRTPLMQDGRPIGLMGIARDITERKAAEEILKLALDNLDACVYITEIETGKILFINNKMAEEYGDADCIGKKCWEVLQKGYSERCDFCPVPKLLESGGGDYVWEEHSTVTGKYYKNTDSFVKWHDGRLVHMQHSVDITDIITAQTKLDRQLNQQSLMTAISQSFLTDADIDTLITNALRMTGEFMNIAQILFYKLEDDGVTLVCKNEWDNPELNIRSLVGEKIRLREQMLNIIKNLAHERDFCLHSNDPSFKAAMAPYRINFQNYITTPIFINGKMYGILDFSKEDDGGLWSKSDINLATLVSSLLPGVFERHLMEEEMIVAKEQAEQGSRSKSDFLSRMSHEIRTPLNAIIGMVNIAMGTDDNGKIQDCLIKADNASKHLLALVNDILDMSKIEADRFELDRREFNFEKMLMNVTNVTNFRAEEKKQNFIVNLNRNVPDSIVGDDLRLSQVLANLLTNAVKFTPEHGTVILNIDRIGDDGGEVTLRLEIEDNGIGISEEQQKRLFTSFEQADGGIARRFGGTGLGLAISKRIVELMGGRIWIESELGKGAKFIFTMKAGKGRGKKRAKLSEKINRDDIRILAVDDSPEIREYFTHVMESLSLPCDVAANGAEALDMVINCGDKPYNIFFIDWQMPEMNGMELTKRIKKKAPDNSVVFMISVAEWGAIEKEAFAVGVRSFISKPLFPSTLVNAINECIEVNPQKPVAGPNDMNGGKARDFKGLSILIAEDVEINREIMSAILEETGIDIDYAENGSIAVSMFKTDPDKYSLVLMDIHMPETDGYEATRRIRALELPQARDIPIIAMTANVFREDIENCLAAGMNDHIGKPVDQDDMFEKLERYLRKKTDTQGQ